MAKFIMVYKGAATDIADMTEKQRKAVMDKWGKWMAKVGPALADIGSPFGPGASMVDDGSVKKAAKLTGYSIVEAASLEAAKKLTKGHPFLSERKGKFSIEVYELMPVPM